VLDEPVVSKDQKAERIKQSNIEVQIHTITSRKNYGQVGNFSKGFSKTTAGGSAVAEVLQLLGVTVVCFLGQKSSL